MKFKPLILFLLPLLFGCDFFVDFEPPKVKILSPASGERVFGSVEIVIDAEDNKKMRKVELYLDGNMTKTFLSGPYNYTWDLTKTNVDAEHIIKAKAFDSGGNWADAEVSFFGYGRRPATPNLINPANGAAFNNRTPTLDWSDVANATVYQLQVDKSGNFTSPIITDSTLTNSAYSVVSPFEDGLYYWRVRARYDVENWSGWSAVWNFTITTKGPPAPTLLNPVDGDSSNNNTPSFDWSDVTGAVEYQLQVDNNSDFSSPDVDQPGLTASTYTQPTALGDGTYYWRVRAKDNVSNWGGWSAARSFTIKTLGPPAPTLTSPADGSSTNDNTPSFDWSDVTGAVEYQLQVDNYRDFSSPEVDQPGLTASAYIQPTPLKDSTYYWWVRAKDNVGNWGKWSAMWSFTIVSPPNDRFQLVNISSGTPSFNGDNPNGNGSIGPNLFVTIESDAQNNTPPYHWRISNNGSSSGYVQYNFDLSGIDSMNQCKLSFNALGSTSEGISYAYLYLEVNGRIIATGTNYHLNPSWITYQVEDINSLLNFNSNNYVQVGCSTASGTVAWLKWIRLDFYGVTGGSLRQ